MRALGLLLRSLPGLGLMVLVAACQHLNPHYNQFQSPNPQLQSTNPGAVAMSSVTLSNRINPSWLHAPTNLFTLGPGDKLEVELLGEPTSRITTVVGPDGKVYFNLLPGIDVWGLTLAQAKAQIERELAKYMKEQPQVSLVLRDVASKHVWVLGRVQAPGVYPLATPMTLLEAISLAGGTLSMSAYRQQETSGANDDLADLRRSFVLRQGKPLPVDFDRLIRQGDLSQNIYLQPDDFVYFPAATTREVYVLGAVTEPKPVAYRQGMTVAQAVAAAYGTINGAYMHHVVVVRGSLTQPQIAVVDYKNVIRGEAPDLALQPGDIVYVPFAPYRYLVRYAELAIDTFVSSAAINAGTSWIGQPIGGASVFIPVGSAAAPLPSVAPPPIH